MARTRPGFHIEMHMTERFALVAGLVEAGAAAQVRKAAYLTRDEAKRRVPVASGALKDTIEVHRLGVGDYEVSAGDQDGGDVDYAAAVEFGTYKMPAKPYLTPALEAGRKVGLAPEKKL